MRTMETCRLIDCNEMPPKSYQNFCEAIEHAMNSRLSQYLEKFICPMSADWPGQFYSRQVVDNIAGHLPLHLNSIVPMMGPLHVSLNAREKSVVLFHPFFKNLYSAVFGIKRHPLAKKPKPGESQ